MCTYITKAISFDQSWWPPRPKMPGLIFCPSRALIWIVEFGVRMKEWINVGQKVHHH